MNTEENKANSAPTADAPHVKSEAGVEVKWPCSLWSDGEGVLGDPFWSYCPGGKDNSVGYAYYTATHTCANPADRKPSGRPERTMAEAAADPVECEKLADEFAGIAPTSLPRKGDWAESELAAIIRSACPQIGDEFLKERASSIDNAFKRGILRGIEWEKKQAALRIAPQPHAGQADAEKYLREHFDEEVRLYLLNWRSTAPAWDVREKATNELLLKFASQLTTPHASESGKLRDRPQIGGEQYAREQWAMWEKNTKACEVEIRELRAKLAALATPAETGREGKTL